MVEELMAAEGLKDNIRILLLSSCEKDQFVVFLKILKHLEQARPELYVNLLQVFRRCEYLQSTVCSACLLGR
jgi:hypothetical protein